MFLSIFCCWLCMNHVKWNSCSLGLSVRSQSGARWRLSLSSARIRSAFLLLQHRSLPAGLAATSQLKVLTSKEQEAARRLSRLHILALLRKTREEGSYLLRCFLQRSENKGDSLRWTGGVKDRGFYFLPPSSSRPVGGQNGHSDLLETYFASHMSAGFCKWALSFLPLLFVNKTNINHLVTFH